MLNKIYLTLMIGVFLTLISGEILAESPATKRTFKECWGTCYQKTCSILAKQYQNERLWSEIETCQQRCKADCEIFEDTKTISSK